MAVKAAIFAILIIGWGLVTLGVAELTTPWLWPISAGVLLLASAAVLIWTAASETEARSDSGPDD